MRTGARLGLPFVGAKLDPVRPSSDDFPVAVHALARCKDKAMTLRMFAPQAPGLRDGFVVRHGRSIARSHVEAQLAGARGVALACRASALPLSYAPQRASDVEAHRGAACSGHGMRCVPFWRIFTVPELSGESLPGA